MNSREWNMQDVAMKLNNEHRREERKFKNDLRLAKDLRVGEFWLKAAEVVLLSALLVLGCWFI